MRIIKKIDIYILLNFLGLFIMTFVICIFILLMQFVWMHITDLVGKGVGLGVFVEFFVYAVASVVPLALPLAILLASLMSFGNMGEKFELTAMKSAGISLFRIMRPLTITVALISVMAFFFSNNVLPVTQSRLWALIFSLRQKSPELDIPVGEFYGGINNYKIYVRDKKSNGQLCDLMIYDFTEGFQDASVILADSGRLFLTADNKYLVLKLYKGETFENLKQGDDSGGGVNKPKPYRRETFEQKNMLIEFDSDFSRYDESVLADQHVSKNVTQLVNSIDSVNQIADKRSSDQSKDMVENKYFARDRLPNRRVQKDSTYLAGSYSVDSIYNNFTPVQRERALRQAVEKAKNMRDQIEYNALLLNDSQEYIRKHSIELHRKFTLSFACLIFFFIGAPLGAIIRKGGLGMPVVISVILFIIYYLIDNTGYKMAREALWPVWIGMWLSSAVLLPIGIFLTYKAATDSALLNPEAWIKVYEKTKNRVMIIFRKFKKAINKK